MDVTDVFFLIFLISTNGSIKIKRSRIILGLRWWTKVLAFAVFKLELRSVFCYLKIITVFKIILRYDNFVSYDEILWQSLVLWEIAIIRLFWNWVILSPSSMVYHVWYSSQTAIWAGDHCFIIEHLNILSLQALGFKVEIFRQLNKSKDWCPILFLNFILLRQSVINK